MRKVLASLFVIVAVVGMGVFATGAYFTDTVTQSNLTFKTGTADLTFGFCPGLSTDCLSAPAPYDNLASFPPADIGPGITNADCMVMENQGAYTLNLTGGVDTYTQSVGGMSLAFLVKAETADSSSILAPARSSSVPRAFIRRTWPAPKRSGPSRLVHGCTSSGRTPGIARAIRTPSRARRSPSTRR